jgi:hypothetical protein
MNDTISAEPVTPATYKVEMTVWLTATDADQAELVLRATIARGIDQASVEFGTIEPWEDDK